MQFTPFFHSFFCLLLSVCCFLPACGKKGEPTLKSYEKPPAPAELKAIHRESEIVLLWNFPKSKEPSIKGFDLMKSVDKDFRKIAFIESDKRAYMDTDFQVGHEYRYKIVSESLKGVISNDSNILEVHPKSPPAPPAGVSLTIERDSVLLSWKPAGEGIFYNVYKSDAPDSHSLMPVNKEPLKENYFKDTFSIKSPVYYAIRSLAGGDIRDEGPASEEIKIVPSEFVPPVLEGLQAVARSEDVYLIWKEPSETWITGYRIYREINKDEGYILIGESQTPSFVDKEPPLTKRNYRVTALGPSKEGPPAEIRDIIYKKPK